MNLREQLLREMKKGEEARGSAKRLKERKEQEIYAKNMEYWNSILQQLMTELPYELKKLARNGKRSYVISRSGGSGEGLYRDALSKFAKENDFIFTEESHHRPSERGDPDSGEGACEAGTDYIFSLTW